MCHQKFGLSLLNSKIIFIIPIITCLILNIPSAIASIDIFGNNQDSPIISNPINGFKKSSANSINGPNDNYPYVYGTSEQKINQYPINKIPDVVVKEGGVITLAGSPYTVEDDIIIPEKSNVFIQPGVELRFAPGVGIDVYGSLIAKGLPNNRIVMTTKNQAIEDTNDKIRMARLVDGPDVSTGTIQLLYKNKWRTVCSQSFNWSLALQNPEHFSFNRWSQHDITVACQSAGYHNGTFSHWLDWNVADSHVHIGSLGCAGDENDVTSCRNWNNGRIGRGICGQRSSSRKTKTIAIQCWHHKCLSKECFSATTHHWRGITFHNASFETKVIRPEAGPFSYDTYFANQYQGVYGEHSNNNPLRSMITSYNGRNEQQHYYSNSQINHEKYVNESKSMLENVDILYGGINKYGQLSPALNVIGGYVPKMHEIVIRNGLFTGIQYTGVSGTIIASDISLEQNKGDGIIINSSMPVNATFDGLHIQHNKGRGLVYDVSPISESTNNFVNENRYFDQFCSFNAKTNGQIYPIYLAGNQYSQCEQEFYAESHIFTIHLLMSRSTPNPKPTNNDDTIVPYLVISMDESDNVYDNVTYLPLLSNELPPSLHLKGQNLRMSVKFGYPNHTLIHSSSYSMAAISDYNFHFALAIYDQFMYDLSITNSHITDNELQGLVLNNAKAGITITHSIIAHNGYRSGLQISGLKNFLTIHNVTWIGNADSALNVTNAEGTINVTQSKVIGSRGGGTGLGLAFYLPLNDDSFINISSRLKECVIDISQTYFMGNQGPSILYTKFPITPTQKTLLESQVSHQMRSPFVENDKVRQSLQITFSRFEQNKDDSIKINMVSPTKYVKRNICSLRDKFILDINNNTFENNDRPGIHIVSDASWPNPCPYAINIGSNTFNVSNGGITFVEHSPQQYIDQIVSNIDLQHNINSNALQNIPNIALNNYLNIEYNYFIRNYGTSVVYVDSPGDTNHFHNFHAPHHSIQLMTRIMYNHFVNNVIRLRARKLDEKLKTIRSRSRINAVLIIAGCSKNILVQRNHFANAPLYSDYEIGTRCTDRSIDLNAAYNWFDTQLVVDQYHVNEIYDKVFDQKMRYNLAGITVHPFLRTENLNGPTSMSPFTRKFMRRSTQMNNGDGQQVVFIGGLLEDRLYLSREYTPYIVSEDIYITKTGELRIDQGVELHFMAGTGMFIEGKIYAIGVYDPYNHKLGKIVFKQHVENSATTKDDFNFMSPQISQDHYLNTYENATTAKPDDLLKGSVTESLQDYVPTTLSWDSVIKQHTTLSVQQIHATERSNPAIKTLYDKINDRLLARGHNVRIGSDFRLHVRLSALAKSSNSSHNNINWNYDDTNNMDEWGTVCNHGWTLQNTMIVCSSLGLVGDPHAWLLKPRPVLKGRNYQDTSQIYPLRIAMNQVTCDQNSMDITNCAYEAETEHSCTHDEDVVFQCVEPRWAGIRFGFYAQSSDLQNIELRDAGLLDYDTGEKIAALTIDYMVHNMGGMEISNNAYQGIHVLYNDIFNPKVFENVRVSQNQDDGMTIRTPSISLWNSIVSDNAGAGMVFNPYMPAKYMRDALSWNGRFRYPNKQIVNVLSLSNPYKLLDMGKFDEIYLYLGPYEEQQQTADITPYTYQNQSVVIKVRDPGYSLAIQHFGSLHLFEGVLSLHQENRRPDHFGNVNEGSTINFDEFLISSPYTLTSNLLRFDISARAHDILTPNHIVVFKIKPYKSYYAKPIVSFVRVFNTTFSRNNDGCTIKTYDSRSNADLFSPFPIGSQFPMVDMHMRFANLTMLFVGSRFESNKQNAISLVSPFHNVRSVAAGMVSNLTLIYENCHFVWNNGIWETADLYSYDSNHIWNIILYKSTFESNYGGLKLFLPYLLDPFPNKWAAKHSILIAENIWKDNINFTLRVGGAYANITILNNVISHNIGLKRNYMSTNSLNNMERGDVIDSALISIANVLKPTTFVNNTVLKNTADTIIKLAFDSNDIPFFDRMARSTQAISVNIKFNYFRYNNPLSTMDLDDIDVYSATSGSILNRLHLIGIYGATNALVNYNIFQVNQFSHMLINGLNYISDDIDGNTFDVPTSFYSQMANNQTSHETSQYSVYDARTMRFSDYSLDATFNYWDTLESHVISNLIFDYYDWNNLGVTKWSPILRLPDIDKPQIHFGSLEHQYFNAEADYLGGLLSKDAILLSRPKPYTVSKDITVPVGKTLTIEEGAILNFEANIGILVHGSLRCQGSPEKPIIFQGLNDVPKSRHRDKKVFQKRMLPPLMAQNRSIRQLSQSFPKTDNNYLPLDLHASKVVSSSLTPQLPTMVRLRDGPHAYEGYLQYFNTTYQDWLPYCDDGFTLTNARIICNNLGYESQYTHFWWSERMISNAVDGEPAKFDLNKMRLYEESNPHPLDCHGYESDWKQCHPRLVAPKRNPTTCFESSYIYIRCGIKPGRFAKSYWGGIRFVQQRGGVGGTTLLNSEHSAHHHHTNSIGSLQEHEILHGNNMQSNSLLSHVIIRGAGKLHGHMAAAIGVIGGGDAAGPLEFDGIIVKDNAWHGIQYFNPGRDVHMSPVSRPISIVHNAGIGINSINLLDMGTYSSDAAEETSNDNINKYYMEKTKSLYLERSISESNAILDICKMPTKTIHISPTRLNSLLVGYEFDSVAKKRCSMAFTLSNQKTLGFRVLHAHNPSALSSPFTRTIISLFRASPFTSQNLIAIINETNIHSRTVYHSNSNELFVYMEADSGDPSEAWIAEIISFPTSAFSKQTSQHFDNIELESNRLSAFQFFTLGKTTPNLQLQKNRIFGNGIHSLNFTSDLPTVSIETQNMQNMLIANNYIGNNFGDTLQILSQSSAHSMGLNAIIANNVLYRNRFGYSALLSGLHKSRSNQELLLTSNAFMENLCPTTQTVASLIDIRHIILNMSNNYVANNLAHGHILAVHGFRDVIPHVAQSVFENTFYNNTVFNDPYNNADIDDNDSLQGLLKYKTISTVFAGSAFQEYTHNLFENTANDFEFAVSKRYRWDLWTGPLLAQHNWWGSNHKSVVKSRIKDNSDEHNMIQIKYEPFITHNTTSIYSICPPGWIHFEDQSCMLYVGGAMRFKEAIEFCNSQGGILPYQISDPDLLKRFIRHNQYTYAPQNLIWVQKQASAYLENYAKCYALSSGDNSIEEISCHNLLPFICEISPITSLSMMEWIEKPYSILVLGILLLAIVFIACVIFCWQNKSKIRKKEAFVRRNSIRSSIRSNRSIKSMNSTTGFLSTTTLSSNGHKIRNGSTYRRPPLGGFELPFFQHQQNDNSPVGINDNNDTPISMNNSSSNMYANGSLMNHQQPLVVAQTIEKRGTPNASAALTGKNSRMTYDMYSVTTLNTISDTGYREHEPSILNETNFLAIQEDDLVSDVGTNVIPDENCSSFYDYNSRVSNDKMYRQQRLLNHSNQSNNNNNNTMLAGTPVKLPTFASISKTTKFYRQPTIYEQQGDTLQQNTENFALHHNPNNALNMNGEKETIGDNDSNSDMSGTMLLPHSNHAASFDANHRKKLEEKRRMYESANAYHKLRYEDVSIASTIQEVESKENTLETYADIIYKPITESNENATTTATTPDTEDGSHSLPPPIIYMQPNILQHNNPDLLSPKEETFSNEQAFYNNTTSFNNRSEMMSNHVHSLSNNNIMDSAYDSNDSKELLNDHKTNNSYTNSHTNIIPLQMRDQQFTKSNQFLTNNHSYGKQTHLEPTISDFDCSNFHGEGDRSMSYYTLNSNKNGMNQTISSHFTSSLPKSQNSDLLKIKESDV